jgi:glycosyltransferase involved in cell wall biosynthesis
VREPSPTTRTTVHVVSSGGVYGVENMLLSLLPELADQGESVSLLCLDGKRSPLVAAALGRGIPVTAVECARPIALVGWVGLFRYLLTHRPTRVHVHGYKAIILAGAMALVLRRCLIVTYHGLAASLVAIAPSLRKYVAAENLVLRRAAAVIAVSAEIHAELIERGVPADRVSLIFNGVSGAPDRENRVPQEGTDRGPQLLAVGRLAEEKNFELLIRVLPSLRAQFPNIRLRIAGDGPLRSELELLAAREGVEDAIEFLGFVSDVKSLHADTACYVMPSKTEGMPMALLEAMSAGSPIVASDVGGIPSMVGHEREALLVPAGDAKELTRAIGRLLTSKADAQRLGAAARRRYEREFTARAMANAYSIVYHSACQ